MFGNCWEIEFSPLLFALAFLEEQVDVDGEFFNEVDGDELFIDVVTEELFVVTEELFDATEELFVATEELFVATEELFVAFVAMIKV